MRLAAALALEPRQQVKRRGRPRLSKLAIKTIAAALRDASFQIPDTDWPSSYVGEIGKFTENQRVGEQLDGLKVAWRGDEVTKLHIGGRKFVAKKKTTERAEHIQYMTVAQWREAILVKEAHLQFRERLWSPDGLPPFVDDAKAAKRVTFSS